MVKNGNILPLLLSKIIKLEKSNGEEIKFTKIDFEIKRRKYSSNECVVILVDDKELSCKDRKTCYVTYICRCGRENKILLHKYIAKQKYWCQHCYQDRSFEDSFVANYLGKIKKPQIQREIIDFDKQSDEFQQKYWETHLHKEEFYKYLPYIYGINGEKIDDTNKVIYLDNDKNYTNQKIYSSRISLDGKKFRSLRSIELQCSVCSKMFSIHPINIRKKDLDNVKCQNCYFSNYIYQVRRYKNTLITYQSNLEKYFLDRCFENHIKVMNGYEIPYMWNDKQHTYISDFYLPDYKTIIEIKGNNQYYRKDLKTGKLQAKTNAAIDFSKENGLVFRLVMEENIDKFISSLE